MIASAPNQTPAAAVQARAMLHAKMSDAIALKAQRSSQSQKTPVNVGYNTLNDSWVFAHLQSEAIDLGSGRLNDAHRAQRLAEENPIANHCLNVAGFNTVGISPKVESASKDTEFAKEANAEIQRVFSGTTLDLQGRMTWGQFNRRRFRLKKRDGDCAVVFVNDNGFPKLQLIPGMLIETPSGEQNTYDGIQVASHRMSGLFVRQRKGMANSHRRVAADNAVFFVERGEDDLTWRGRSAFTGTFDFWNHIYGTCEAVVVAMRSAACTSMVAEFANTGNHPDDPLVKLMAKAEEDPALMEKVMALLMPAEQDLNAGGVLWGMPSRTYKPFTPAQPSQSMTEATRLFISIAALRLGVALPDALLDYTGMNYTVSRALRLATNKVTHTEQKDDDETFYARVVPWILALAIKAGRIKRRPPKDWAATLYTPDIPPVVDELSHITAVREKLSLSLTDHDRESRTLNGEDHDVILEKRKQTRQKLIKNKEEVHASFGISAKDVLGLATEEIDA